MFRNWLELWPKGVQHITANSRLNGHALPHNEDHYSKLRLINQEIFPKLADIHPCLTETTLNKNITLTNCWSGHIIEGNNICIYV